MLKSPQFEYSYRSLSPKGLVTKFGQLSLRDNSHLYMNLNFKDGAFLIRSHNFWESSATPFQSKGYGHDIWTTGTLDGKYSVQTILNINHFLIMARSCGFGKTL